VNLPKQQETHYNFEKVPSWHGLCEA